MEKQTAFRSGYGLSAIILSLVYVFCAELSGYQHFDLLPEHFIACVPKDHCGLVVDQHDRTRFIYDHYRVGIRVKQRFICFYTIQCLWVYCSFLGMVK